MANCNNLFQDFLEVISIASSKREKMIRSREALRKKIRLHFKVKYPDYAPFFYMQGSHRMGTGIRTKDDICDLDDGIYFFRAPDVEGNTLQKWVREAVENHTATPPQHRKKCIRNIFAGDYDIDMPVYCKIKENGEIKCLLAVKNGGYEYSDPKALIEWFNGLKKSYPRLKAMVKYLKAWCDWKRNKMPSGLAMTILAANAIQRIASNKRDDILLRDILVEIEKALKDKFECVVPVLPHDDLFGEYDDARQNRLMDALEDFIRDANAALKEPNQEKASKLWRVHLGDRFPIGEDEEEETGKLKGLIAGAKTSRPWAI